MAPDEAGHPGYQNGPWHPLSSGWALFVVSQRPPNVVTEMGVQNFQDAGVVDPLEALEATVVVVELTRFSGRVVVVGQAA